MADVDEDRGSPRDLGFSAAAFVLALLPRLYVAIAWAREPVWDGHYYDFGARRIAAGLGYSDDKIRQLCRDGISEGWSHFKIKVGRDLADDIRRASLIREVIGPDRKLMVDANQVWDVGQAIEWMTHLAPFDPWWIEEPTSPDDVLGQAVKAFVVLEPGTALDARAIQQACAARLESFMVPKHVEIVAELAKGATGKIQKTGLA